MSLQFKTGDLFAQSSEALVNTVNCVGVMGKGVALEFKKRWPSNYVDYKRLCDRKQLRPGRVYVHEVGDMFGSHGPRFIINFPTKDHWRSKSKLEFVEAGLDALSEALQKYKISSVALPPLGCGNGGLSWEDVKPLIVQRLGCLPAVDITVLEPTQVQDSLEHGGKSLSMTFPRAMLLKSLGDLEPLFDGMFDRISLQKVVYFLQALGVPYGLAFKRNLFGPYSETLRKALVALESYEMINGFTSEERLTRVTPAGYALSDEFLNQTGKADHAHSVVDRLSKLIEGFEGPYGLELLATVHDLAVNDELGGVEQISEAMGRWSDNKRNKFATTTIERAFNRLKEDGLLSEA
jgi:O-acetyl-ADP-ribose deacetylase (regulator of RNase III)/uncharacterized protein YwgA